MHAECGQMRCRSVSQLRGRDVFNALNKHWYPGCVGQLGSWVISPLSLNLLLSFLKGAPKAEKYVQIYKTLKSKKNFKVNTGIFYSVACKIDETLRKADFNDIRKEQVDFTKTAASTISQWINQNNVFKDFNAEQALSSSTQFALINTCCYENNWEATSPNGRVMKVYNSFQYTQDVNYEARIMELPMKDTDLRMVVLVPNEADLLHTLYRRLTNEGLAASFASIQPLFSVDSVFRPPNIAIESHIDIHLENKTSNDFPNESILQYGNALINENGTTLKVLTCLFSTEAKPAKKDVKTQNEKAPFFFAITYKDTPIFTGQYSIS